MQHPKNQGNPFWICTTVFNVEVAGDWSGLSTLGLKNNLGGISCHLNSFSFLEVNQELLVANLVSSQSTQLTCSRQTTVANIAL